MKNFKLKFPILSMLTMVLFLFCITSCQDEIEMDYNPEDSISTIENTNLDEATEQKTIEPVLYANFDASLSKEEAEAKWKKMVSDFTKTQVVTDKGVSTEWFTSVSTLTGTQTNNGTSSSSSITIKFRSNFGTIYRGPFSFNAIPHTESGSWNYYLFRASVSNSAVSWLEIESATIFMWGNDNWFLKNLNVLLFPMHQSVNSSGFAYLFDTPNTWLGSNNFWSWDYYETQDTDITGGRLSF